MKKETLKNNVSSGSLFNVCVMHDDYPILHTHDFWEFMLVTNGSYNHIVNGKDIEIKKNVLCLIRPADKHSIKKLSENVSHINFVVPDEIMRNQLNIIMYGWGKHDQVLGSEPIHFEISERALQNYIEIVTRTNLLEQGSMQWHNSITQLFLTFIQSLVKYWGRQYMSSNKDILKKVKEIIDSIHFANESSKTLAEIISDSNYSYIHASRLFKSHMNMTLKEYQTKEKMKTATRLLEDPSLSVIQVAEKLGYQSLSHFNIVFKKHFEISPSKYRNYWSEFYSSFEDG